MSYITQTDVEGRLKQNLQGLYALPEDQKDLDTDMASAEGVVNSFVGKRYAVPVTDATAVAFLKPVTLDIFAATAWARGQGDELPKKVKDAYDAAFKLLKDIAKGDITLGGATALAERPSGGAEAIIVDGNTPEFTREQMEGF